MVMRYAYRPAGDATASAAALDDLRRAVESTAGTVDRIANEVAALRRAATAPPPPRWSPVAPRPVTTARIADLPGATPFEVDALRRIGLNVCDPLQYVEVPSLAAATGIPVERLERLRELGEILSLEGMEPTWAAALCARGVRSLDDLASAPVPFLQSIFAEAEPPGWESVEGIEALRRILPELAADFAASARAAVSAVTSAATRGAGSDAPPRRTRRAAGGPASWN